MPPEKTSIKAAREALEDILEEWNTTQDAVPNDFISAGIQKLKEWEISCYSSDLNQSDGTKNSRPKKNGEEDDVTT